CTEVAACEWRVVIRAQLVVGLACRADMRARAERFATRESLEVPFLLLLLHRSRTVVVDHASLPLGASRVQCLVNDGRQRICTTFDGARQRIATERAEAYPAHLRLFAVLQGHALVIHHDPAADA